MGIKFFYKYISQTFPKCISSYPVQPITTLYIDGNCILHTTAQKVYKYGAHAQPQRFLTVKKPVVKSNKDQEFIQMVASDIFDIIDKIKPTTRVVLCIDGVCPISKQSQQRLRRFKSSKETNPNFDSNAISVGTKLLHDTTNYLSYYFQKCISSDSYKHLEFVFSSEKIPGEGEHKIISYIRKYQKSKHESGCVMSVDADLIMLLLSTHTPNLSILRISEIVQDTFVDINILRTDLVDYLSNNTKVNDDILYITDFVLVCFFVGNDFLPNIPTIEIINNALDEIMVEYRDNFIGHLTNITNNKVELNRDNLITFLSKLASKEETFINNKLQFKDNYIKDEMLERHTNSENKINFKEYRLDYYKSKFGDDYDVVKICEQYLTGVIWNINYYDNGISDWDWYFPFHFGPFLYDLVDILKNSFKKTYLLKNTKPNEIFKQLLSILPPPSKTLLPNCLVNVLDNELTNFCPLDFKVDTSGKYQVWEGVVVIPFLDQQYVYDVYEKYKSKFTATEQERNQIGTTVVYKYNKDNTYTKISRYGNFKCCVQQTTINL